MRRAIVQRAQHWPASTQHTRACNQTRRRSRHPQRARLRPMRHGNDRISMAGARGRRLVSGPSAAGSRARRPRCASTARHSGSAAWRPCSAKARHRQQRCPPRRRGPRWQVALLEHVTGLVTRAAVLQSEITPPPTPRARVPLAEAFLAPLRGRRESVRPQAQGRAAVGGGGPRVGVLDVPRSSQVARGAVQKV